MEPLRKSPKSYSSYSKNQPQQEGKQALLCNLQGCQMKQSHDSHDQKEEMVVKIDKSNGIAATSSPESSRRKLKVSFEEVVNDALQESYSVSSRQKSWRLLINKTKSRLIDPPDEQYQRVNESEENDHEEDDIEDMPEELKKMKSSAVNLIQWVTLVLLMVTIVFSLSIPGLKRQIFWGLPLWKWEIMILALICGRLVSGWGIRIVVFFIERNFIWRKRVLYFVYGLRRPVQNCLWLGLVLLVWHLVFDRTVEEETKSKVLLYATKVLVCFLAGTLIWLLKTLLVKVLASSFHVQTFFERIQEALFNQYVMETLSGPPLFERQNQEDIITEEQQSQHYEDLEATLLAKKKNGVGTLKLQKCHSVGKRPRFSREMTNKKDEEILIDHLHKLNQKNISAWNMKRMINIVRHGALSTLDEQILDSKIEDESLLHIRSAFQAREAAKKIFQKVVKKGSQYIYLDDVMHFMGKEEALRAMRHFGAACENDGISKSSLKNWAVDAFRERRALACSLNDTKTAVDQLHNMLNIVVIIIIAIVWLIILGIPITHFLVFISSQLLLVAFIFGNSCKTTFEAIIFLFIMHPFDVGDRCEVDGITMVVEEMNILTTVFLRSDHQKIIYPNSVLATKPIGNFYRSPEMIETIDFCIQISTPMDKIATMKERIKGCVNSNSDHWHQNATVAVTEVEDMNKMKMSVWLKHKMNYQDMGERWVRRAHMIEEMIKVFSELEIEYRMLPLDVNVRNIPPLVSDRIASSSSYGN